VISQNETDKQLWANPFRQVPVTILEEADNYGFAFQELDFA
jgi:hypothetical protein